MSRTVPLTGTDQARRFAEAKGKIRPNEIHTTTDTRRFFLEGRFVGPAIWHGDIANEAAMLALNSSPDGCYPGDACKRTDLNALARCIANRGESLSDWKLMTLGVGTTGGYDETWQFKTARNADGNDEIVFANGEPIWVYL